MPKQLKARLNICLERSSVSWQCYEGAVRYSISPLFSLLFIVIAWVKAKRPWSLFKSVISTVWTVTGICLTEERAGILFSCIYWYDDAAFGDHVEPQRGGQLHEFHQKCIPPQHVFTYQYVSIKLVRQTAVLKRLLERWCANKILKMGVFFARNYCFSRNVFAWV